MSPPDDTPLVAHLPRWSEWWFAPRWRALLTWLALTAITSAVLYAKANWMGFVEMTHQPIDYLNRFLPVPVSPLFSGIALRLSVLLLLIWFQPLALRLSLRRGLAWMGFPMIAVILKPFLFSAFEFQWVIYGVDCGAAALQSAVLWGWRSRPWMCLMAWAAMVALWGGPLRHHFPTWLDNSVLTLPSAALLLYGTRLLRPEERVQRQS